MLELSIGKSVFNRPIRFSLVVTLALMVLAIVPISPLGRSMAQRPAVVQTDEAYIRLHELPNPILTPGAVRTTDTKDICTRSTKTIRHVTIRLKKQVYAAYGNSGGNNTGFCMVPEGCEVDHLVSLELGGSNDPKNLWPEPYSGVTWNAHVKDRLENELHSQICTGKITAEEAQHKIATNWIQAYCGVFSSDPKCPASP